MKMEDNEGEEEVVEYEYLAILGMKLGRDNVNDFINGLL